MNGQTFFFQAYTVKLVILPHCVTLFLIWLRLYHLYSHKGKLWQNILELEPENYQKRDQLYHCLLIQFKCETDHLIGTEGETDHLIGTESETYHLIDWN